MGVIERVKNVVAKAQATHPGRAYQRYGDARGNVLAGGVAYFAFFSIFPALAVAATVLGFVMRAVPEVRDVVVHALVEVGDTYLSGLVHPGVKPAGEDDAPGIYIDQFLLGATLNVTLLISMGTLLFTGLGWIDGMRQGIRAVFGEDSGGGNFAVVKVRDLLVLVLIGVGVALSVLSGVGTNAAGGWLLGLVSMADTTGGTWLLRIAGFAVAFGIDTCTFLAVFRFLPGANVPFRDLLSGAVIGAAGIGFLKQFGTTIAKNSAQNNAFLGAAASIVVLLVLMNLIGRVILLAAAWAATNAEDTGSLGPMRELVGAQFVTPVGPEPAQPARTPTSRGQDRTSLVSGVVLGALGAGVAYAGRTVLQGVRLSWKRR
ncbi:MAG: YihY/virulence factor BrkB family protein [Janthinobacterium lividum]